MITVNFDITGVEGSLSWCSRYRRNPPAEAQRIVNGRRPLTRVEEFERRLRTHRRRQQADKYDALRAADEEVLRGLAGEFADARTQIEKAWSGFKNGSVSAEEVQAWCAEAMAATRQFRGDLDRVESNRQAAIAFINRTPDEYEQELIERGLYVAPVVTESWLRGESDRDPLGVTDGE